MLKQRESRLQPEKKRISQAEASAWDVVVLSFKLFLPRILFWIHTNLIMIFFSLGIVTMPASIAAMYHTIVAGLRDPGGSMVNSSSEMKIGFRTFFFKAFLLSLIKWAVYILIGFSIVFWSTRDTWTLRLLTIISLYFLVIWWISSGYFFPVLIEEKNINLIQVIKKSLYLGISKPFQSLLFAIVTTLLLIFGVILLGPVLLIIPVLITIIMTQGYWFITGNEIPGFMEIYEYINLPEKSNSRGSS